MHLVIEKYRNDQSTTQPPEPILVPFKRYSRECVVSAIMEFISYNFIMDSPPKYRDSEGDMILLETREAFEVLSRTFISLILLFQERLEVKLLENAVYVSHNVVSTSSVIDFYCMAAAG